MSKKLAFLALLLAGCDASEPVTSSVVSHLKHSTDYLGFSSYARENTAGAAGQFYTSRVDNWNPLNDLGEEIIGRTTVVMVAGFDPYGTLLTGIDASNVMLGDILIICNSAANLDAGTVMLSNEDSRSADTNRIRTPNAAHAELGPQQDRFAISTASCQPLIYTQPEPNDRLMRRWMVIGSSPRINRALVASLHFYPDMTPAPLPVGVENTTQNYAPIDTCPHCPGVSEGGAGDSGESGGGIRGADHTAIRLTTSDVGTAYIGGLDGDYENADYNGHPWTLGPVKLLVNYGPGKIVLRDRDVHSENGNKFSLSGGDLTIQKYGSVMLWHSNHDSFWFVIGGEPGRDSWPRTVATTLTAGASNVLSSNDTHASKYILVQTNGAADLVGMAAGAAGEEHTVCNYSASPVTVRSHDASAGPGQQFWIVDDESYVLGRGGCMNVWYDASQPVWLMTGGSR
jgi:hypothetical protein